MNTNTFAVDQTLAQIISSATLATIDDVLAVMRGLDQSLANNDGLKWFNLLYLKVTESVKTSPPTGGFEDPVWLSKLDVEFAKLYFDSIIAWQRNPAAVSRAWRPLFQARLRPRLARVQFALAGMNAHINHDLALAVVRTDDALGLKPKRNSPQFRDFQRVNEVLVVAEAQAKEFIATGIVGVIDQKLGQVDDVLAMWSVKKARETAWNNAELLWRIRHVAIAKKLFLENLENLVGLSSQGILLPVL